MDWISALPLLGKLWNWLRSRLGPTRKHDIAIFRKLDAIANEPHVDEILNERIYTSNLRLEDNQILVGLIDAMNRIENQYLDGTVRLRAEQLAWEMKQLLDFVYKTFWSCDGGLLKFRPDPIDPKVNDAEWRELNNKLESTWAAYRAYRQVVKERLKV